MYDYPHQPLLCDFSSFVVRECLSCVISARLCRSSSYTSPSAHCLSLRLAPVSSAGGSCLKQEDDFEDLIETHFKKKKIILKQDSTITDLDEATGCCDDKEMMPYPLFVDLVEEISNIMRLSEREPAR